MKRASTICLLFMLRFLSASGQTPEKAVKFWKLYDWSGELKASLFYRDQLRKGLLFDEHQQSLAIAPSLMLRAKNYIWHPRFMCVDVEGQYAPAKATEKYLVVPDQSETRDMKKLDVRATLLPQYKVSLATYFNYSQLVSLRENLSNIRSSGKVWGSTVFFRGKGVPLTLNFSGRDEDQKEVQTGRRFIGNQQNLELSTNNTFGKWYKQNISVSHNNYYRKDFTFYEVRNRINDLSFSNQILFSQKKATSLSGFLSGVQQTGSDTFTRYQATGNLSVQLLKSLQSRSSYNYFADLRPMHNLVQHRMGTSLQHQLFESLQTTLMYEYNKSVNTAFSQNLRSASANITYTKKILKAHTLDISFRKMITQQEWLGNDQAITVLNEAVPLKDGEITLLLRQGVNIATVVVRNSTGNIIYQPGFDYLLIQQNNFIQLLRVRGGQIPNNTVVYVDYQSVQPGNYSYVSNSHQFHAGLSLFQRKLSVYYRRSVQHYDKLYKADFLTLNYFDEFIYGIKADFRFLEGGAEYDNNLKNTILPFDLYRYFLRVQGTLMNNLSVFVNGNYNHYRKLGQDQNVNYMDLSGNLNYPLSRKAALSGAISYMKQDGAKVNLDLLTCRARFDFLFFKIRTSLIYNFYDRRVFQERIRSHAVNVELVRKF